MRIALAPKNPRRMIWIPITLVLLFFAIGFAFRLFEGTFLYFPRSLENGRLQELTAIDPVTGAIFSEVSIPTEDGETLVGWHGEPKRIRGTLLWFHGNAGSLEHRYEDLRGLVAAGLEVLVVDYRGYGRSTGSPSEEGLYLDARASLDYLESELGTDPGRVVLLGRSLGGAVAVELATERKVRGVVIESSFTSLADMAKRVVRWFPAHWFAKSEFGTEERLVTLTVPVLLFHGTADEVVPFDHGETLAAAGAGLDLEFVPVEGAGHNDVSTTMGREYFDRVVAFVERCLR